MHMHLLISVALTFLQLLCDLLELLFPHGFHCPKPPHHPPPPTGPPGYGQSFYNLTCAAQDDSYQTFGLVATVEGIFSNHASK
jgi:hypothetical protein